MASMRLQDPAEGGSIMGMYFRCVVYLLDGNSSEWQARSHMPRAIPCLSPEELLVNFLPLNQILKLFKARKRPKLEDFTRHIYTFK
jgi:hypothetical protein